MSIQVGSVFAGIGGFELGFDQAGMETAWQVENNKQCNTVLAHRWPGARRFQDVREEGAGTLPPDGSANASWI